MRVPFNALISLSAEAMPHARLPLPIKTCLYKVYVLISSIINISAIQALANPAHSKPNLLPQCSVGRD